MKRLTFERAHQLKEKGITHIASVVNSCYFTTYYGVASIDDILANGGRRPKNALYVTTNGEVLPCESGTNGKNVDWIHTVTWSCI